MKRNLHVRFCRRVGEGDLPHLANDDGALRCVPADPKLVAEIAGLHVNAVAPPYRQAWGHRRKRGESREGAPLACMSGFFVLPRMVLSWRYRTLIRPGESPTNRGSRWLTRRNPLLLLRVQVHQSGTKFVGRPPARLPVLQFPDDWHPA
jgi:hypothetical protein